MQFRLDRFYRINRRALIWVAIIGLLYILRDFFALIFLTFLLVSFTRPVIDYFRSRTRVPRTVVIVTLYLIILAALVGGAFYVAPRITAEASAVASELNTIQSKLLFLKEDLKRNYPSLAPLLDQYVDTEQVKQYLEQLRHKVQPLLIASAKIAVAAVSTILLALLFSFLIVLDLTRLKHEVRLLEQSRLHDLYVESAQPVVRFAQVIAKSFRAQAMIALTNSVLTLAGFLILGLPKVALLTIIVFFFSFIPVLGVFISTTPAVLVAINAAGYGKAIGVVVMVIVIHMVEAYVLNPFIYGRHLKLNPVLVLIILFVGHHFFGMWGMLLGVPVAYYFLYYVFGVPLAADEAQAMAMESLPGEPVPEDVSEAGAGAVDSVS